MERTCPKCQYHWIPKVADPKMCPRCHAYLKPQEKRVSIEKPSENVPIQATTLVYCPFCGAKLPTYHVPQTMPIVVEPEEPSEEQPSEETPEVEEDTVIYPQPEEPEEKPRKRKPREPKITDPFEPSGIAKEFEHSGIADEFEPSEGFTDSLKEKKKRR